MPPPPHMPLPMLWQCHRCLNVYRLSCTRRCLECSHTYCILASSQTKPINQGQECWRRTAMCTAKFDYVGWEQWGLWRRNTLGFSAVSQCGPMGCDKAFVKRTHNCWTDCDSPSQCHHRRYKLAAKASTRRPAELEELCQSSPLLQLTSLEGNEDEDEDSQSKALKKRAEP
ncbi:hypothetical protein F5Y06DRAFT_270080, partial [Hypoxylon sp. FL0890]